MILVCYKGYEAIRHFYKGLYKSTYLAHKPDEEELQLKI